MSKKSKVIRPNRDPDHYSKRGVPYWWAPEWTRGTSADETNHEYLKGVIGHSRYPADMMIINSVGNFVWPCDSYGRIHAVKESSGDVSLYMKSKEGKLTYIQGSIQKEFKKWHLDRSIDYILLGMDPDEIIAREDLSKS